MKEFFYSYSESIHSFELTSPPAQPALAACVGSVRARRTHAYTSDPRGPETTIRGTSSYNPTGSDRNRDAVRSTSKTEGDSYWTVSDSTAIVLAYVSNSCPISAGYRSECFECRYGGGAGRGPCVACAGPRVPSASDPHGPDGARGRGRGGAASRCALTAPGRAGVRGPRGARRPPPTPPAGHRCYYLFI